MTRLRFRQTQPFNWRVSKPIRSLGRSRDSNSYATTPDDQPRILASIQSGFKAEPLQPPPPDAKTQATTAFRQMGMVILYSGLGVGVTALVGFFGIHLWVEFCELPSPGLLDRLGRIDKDQSLHGWDHELVGWGAAQGASHSSIGWHPKMLIRAAWVAENWQSGKDGVEVQQDSSPDCGTKLVDSAYLLSESKLEEAITLIKQSNAQLDALDPSLFRLQSCLASLSERINTHSSLKNAYAIYSDLSNALIASIGDHQTDFNRDWKMAQSVRTIEKLAQVGLRIVDFERLTNPSQARSIEEETEKYLIWAVDHTLGIPQKPTDHPVIPTHSEQQSMIREKSSKSSWLPSFTLFGRFGNNPTPKDGLSDNPRRKKILYSHLDSIQERLSQLSNKGSNSSQSQLSWSPIQLRLMVSSLLRLSTHLVSINSLSKALEIQNQVDGFLSSLVKSDQNTETEPSQRRSADGKLQEYWLKSRLALSQTYLSQIKQACNPQPNDRQEADDRSWMAGLLDELERECATNPAFKPGFARAFSGRLSEQAGQLKNDLRLITAM